MKPKHNLLRAAFCSVIFVAFILGCVAAIPIAVHYYKTHKNYVATAEVRKKADDLWLAIGRVADKREDESSDKQFKILKRDDANRLLEATDGVQTASIKIISEGRSKSKLIITADSPEGKGEELDREKELAAGIMKALCEEAKADCKLVEQ